MKQFLFTLLAMIAVVVSACTSAPQADEDTNVDIDVGEQETGGKMCIQVITPAKNDATGECRDFPTPCDVPAGWTKVDSCETGAAGPKVVEMESSRNVKTFDLTMKQFEMDPSILRVKKGDHVIINAFSEDVAHGIMIPEYNINVNVPAGETRKIEFDATKVGSYGFRCSVACGSGHSRMTGTIIVE